MRAKEEAEERYFKRHCLKNLPRSLKEGRKGTSEEEKDLLPFEMEELDDLL